MPVRVGGRLRSGESLNERTTAYLLATFKTAQEVEAEVRDLPYRPHRSGPPQAFVMR